MALVVVGLVTLFFLPWLGIPLGVAGLGLFIAFLLGFGQRAQTSET